MRNSGCNRRKLCVRARPRNGENSPVEEVMRGLDDLVRQGKVSLRRHLGRSRMVDRPGKPSGRASRLDTVYRLQIEYSLIERTVERELIPMAKALNLGVLAW